MMLLSVAIRPKSPDDASRLTQALEQLAAEGATIQSRVLEEHVVLGGISEQQIERVIDRLKRDFNVNAGLDTPEIVYREAITRPAEAEAKYARHAATGGEYAHVKIRLVPEEFGSGYRFENRVTGGAIPARFIESVNQGIQEQLTQGVFGYPVEDVSVILDDGSYHDRDSSDAAFRTAGFLAAEEGLRRGHPVLLEPVMDLQIVVPADCSRDVMDNMLERRGQIQSVEPEGARTIIHAVAPLAQLFGYAVDFRMRTRGLGTHTMAFRAYVPFRRPDDGRDDAVVTAPIRPRPSPRSSAVSLPEPHQEDPRV